MLPAKQTTQSLCWQYKQNFDGDVPFTPRGCFAQAWRTLLLVLI